MSNHKVVSLASKREARDAKAEFLNLLDGDMGANPQNVRPIPSELLDRLNAVCDAIEENENNEAIEC